VRSNILGGFFAMRRPFPSRLAFALLLFGVAPSAAAETAVPAATPVPPPHALFVLHDELIAGTAAITAWGVFYWHWFEREPHFRSEHGFTARSPTGGADKVAHALTGTLFSDFLAWRLERDGHPPLRAGPYGALAALALMTWIEVGDATSRYGFSVEDLTADVLGVAFSLARQAIPGARDLADFRVEYWPTSAYWESGEVVADYSGMKFLLALRLSGLGPAGRTPLRFLELHLGYYTRGFRTFDENQEDASRHLYLGAGLDLKELLEPFLPDFLLRPAAAALTYYQPPATAIGLIDWTR